MVILRAKIFLSQYFLILPSTRLPPDSTCHSFASFLSSPSPM